MYLNILRPYITSCKWHHTYTEKLISENSTRMSTFTKFYLERCRGIKWEQMKYIQLERRIKIITVNNCHDLTHKDPREFRKTVRTNTWLQENWVSIYKKSLAFLSTNNKLNKRKIKKAITLTIVTKKKHTEAQMKWKHEIYVQWKIF